MDILSSPSASCVHRPVIARGRWPWLVGGALGGLAYAMFLRPRLLRWGASAEEASASLPGDDLAPGASYATTRAVTIQAPPEAVWPWLVQLGQGRGGFYTYDRLEQFVGAAIQSADRIVPEWQTLAEGDVVLLSPVGGPTAVRVEAPRALVLEDTMDLRTSRSLPKGTRTAWSMNWTWAFVLRPVDNETTRLVIRTRASFRPRALLALAAFLLLEPVHHVMEHGMLLGIKGRAERTGRDTRPDSRA